MSAPAWIRPNAVCVCIDDAWRDFDTQEPTRSPAPVLGQRYVVASAHDLGYAAYLMLKEFGPGAGIWSAGSFRPLSDEELDIELFTGILKDAAASAARELEPAS